MLPCCFHIFLSQSYTWANPILEPILYLSQSYSWAILFLSQSYSWANPILEPTYVSLPGQDPVLDPMNPSSSSSSPRLPTRIPLWDDATTVVSEVTVPEQLDEEGGGDLGDDKEPLDSLDDSDVAMLSACPKKTARQKTRDRAGRK